MDSATFDTRLRDSLHIFRFLLIREHVTGYVTQEEIDYAYELKGAMLAALVTEISRRVACARVLGMHDAIDMVEDLFEECRKANFYELKEFEKARLLIAAYYESLSEVAA